MRELKKVALLVEKHESISNLDFLPLVYFVGLLYSMTNRNWLLSLPDFGIPKIYWCKYATHSDPIPQTTL